VKIRCRSRRTSSSTVRQSTASQSRAASSVRSPPRLARRRPTCPSVRTPQSSRSSTGSPDPRQRPFRPGHQPVSGQLSGGHQRRSWSYGRRFPAAFRRTGVRFLGHRSPAEDLGLPHGRLTDPHRVGPQRGCHVAHEQDATGQDASFARGRWCAPGRRLVSGRRPPLSSGQSLRPRWNIPPAGLTFTRRHQGFTRVRPSPRHGWPPHPGREAAC